MALIDQIGPGLLNTIISYKKPTINNLPDNLFLTRLAAAINTDADLIAGLPAGTPFAIPAGLNVRVLARLSSFLILDLSALGDDGTSAQAAFLIPAANQFANAISNWFKRNGAALGEELCFSRLCVKLVISGSPAAPVVDVQFLKRAA